MPYSFGRGKKGIKDANNKRTRTKTGVMASSIQLAANIPRNSWVRLSWLSLAMFAVVDGSDTKTHPQQDPTNIMSFMSSRHDRLEEELSSFSLGQIEWKRPRRRSRQEDISSSKVVQLPPMTPENEIVNVDGTGLGLYMTSAMPTTTTTTSTSMTIPTVPTITISYEKRKVVDLAMPISPAILKSVCQPLVPQSTWSALTGKEFYIPSSVQELAKTGIRTASSESQGYIDWKPDKATSKLLDLESTHPGALKEALAKDGVEGQVLVFMGKFKEKGHGSDLPVVKTRSILPLSPRDFCNLLMDSSRVKSYNKMSLGRVDKVVFQTGVDTREGGFGQGETKIVRNLTKPPLTKKTIEFVTLMHARPLTSQDQVGPGILGGTGTTNHHDKDEHEADSSTNSNSSSGGGYIVVSRAIPGGDWNSEGDGDLTRSEILLGVNLVRPVPGHPNKSEVTAVTHVHSPSIPTMLAGTVGVKGAVDFVRDIRSLQD